MANYTIDLSRLQAKKVQTLKIADSYERLSVRPGLSDFRRRAALCRNCGNYLKYGVLRDGSTKLVDANFCRQRLCPACSFRRSHKAFANICHVMDWVDKYSDCRYIFVTLTVVNVPGDGLSSALQEMAVGFKRLISARGKSRRFIGFIRTTEVTYSSAYDTYHPHYHCIIAVPSHYFDDPELYWTAFDWSQAWRQSLGVEYNPVVWVEAIKDQVKGVKEVSKYCVKPASLLEGAPLDVDERLLILHDALNGKRLLSYTGIFAEARRALRLPEEDQDTLVDQVSRDDVFQLFVTYHWGFGSSSYEIEREDYR